MPLTDVQIEMLQICIDACMPGTYDALDIILSDFKEYFDSPTRHGSQFKKAVLAGVFQNIEHRPPVPGGNNHQRYVIRGG